MSDETSPVPRDLLGETLIGKSLASLLEEMQTQIQRLPSGEPTAVNGQSAVPTPSASSAMTADDIEKIATSAVQAAMSDMDASLGAAPALDSTEIANIMQRQLSELTREIEMRMQEELKSAYAKLKGQFERALAQRSNLLRARVVEVLKREVESVRSQQLLQVAQERQAVRRDYQRMLTLANKIARQKAGINRARAQLEGKLQAADRLQKEIFQLREMLSQQLGDLDGIELEPAADPATDTSHDPGPPATVRVQPPAGSPRPRASSLDMAAGAERASGAVPGDRAAGMTAQAATNAPSRRVSMPAASQTPPATRVDAADFAAGTGGASPLDRDGGHDPSEATSLEETEARIRATMDRFRGS